MGHFWALRQCKIGKLLEVSFVPYRLGLVFPDKIISSLCASFILGGDEAEGFSRVFDEAWTVSVSVWLAVPCM